jgi:hypothetical protein
MCGKKLGPLLRTENRELRTSLNKHVLHASQQRPVLRFIFHRRQFCQFGQQFALAFSQFRGGLYSHLNEKIAFAVPIEHRHAFVPDAKRGSRLRALRDFQLVFSLQRRNYNLRAQGGLRERNRNHAVQVVALALKEGVLFDVQDNIQVAGWPAERARFAQTGETNSRAVLHSRRHLSLDHTLAQQAAFTFALRAWIGDYATRALASWAGSSDAEEALLIPHLAAPIARPAGDRSFAGRRTVPAARVAGLMAADIHFLISAEDRFLKFEMQVFAKVGSALGAAATTSALAEHVTKTEDVAEDVAEILEDGRIESRWPSGASADASMSEAVIQRSFLAIGEDCVRFRDLLKLVLRLRIVRIAVRMIRHRQLAVSALDFNLGGRARDTENFVKIAFRVSGQKLPPLVS